MSEETQTTDPTAYAFNWHDLSSHEDLEEFLRWAVVHLITPNSNDIPDKMDEVKKATSDFTDVRLQVIISGVEVNAEHFIKGLHYNLRRKAEKLAVERITATTELANLEKTVRVLQGAVRDRAEVVARGLGLRLRSGDDD